MFRTCLIKKILEKLPILDFIGNEGLLLSGCPNVVILKEKKIFSVSLEMIAKLGNL